MAHTSTVEAILPQAQSEYHRHYLSLIEGVELKFDSREERTLALLLHHFGFLKRPLEGINVHTPVNSHTRHSVDFFLPDLNVAIEYHPLHWSESKSGLTADDISQARASQLDLSESGQIEYLYLESLNVFDLLDLLQLLLHISREHYLEASPNILHLCDLDHEAAIELLENIIAHHSN